MALKFTLWQNKNDYSVRAVFAARNIPQDSSGDYVKIGEVVCEQGAASTLTSLMRMPGSQGESFQETLEELVTEAYKKGREDSGHLSSNLSWPPGHD